MNKFSKRVKDIIENQGHSDETNVRVATAPYQADFPHAREEEAQVTRREFCDFLGLTSAALFVGAAGFAAKAAIDGRESKTFPTARIDGAEMLAPNSSLNFNYPTERDSAILIRTADGAYHAYGQKCTHLSCPVYYSRENHRLECPCHEAAFEATSGNILYGPPARALDVIDVEVGDGAIWANGRKAST